ncbi:unnamed protein product, partial [Iphiclides podalirius]
MRFKYKSSVDLALPNGSNVSKAFGGVEPDVVVMPRPPCEECAVAGIKAGGGHKVDNSPPLLATPSMAAHSRNAAAEPPVVNICNRRSNTTCSELATNASNDQWRFYGLCRRRQMFSTP